LAHPSSSWSRRLLTWLAFAGVVLSAGVVVVPAAQAAGTASISGTVTASGLPLADVSVELEVRVTGPGGGYWETVGYVSTDGEGDYTFGGLATGEYQVSYYAYGYLYQYWNGGPDRASATPIVVSDGATVANVDAALSAGGTVSGTVYAEGVPLENVEVDLYRTFGEGVEAYWDSTASTFTDADGRYSFVGLNTGTYRVGFAALAYLPAYWNAASTVESATDVAVTAGDSTTGIDASLELGASVAGRLTTSDGTPPSEVQVKVLRWNSVDPSASAFVADAYTASDGTYEVEGLTAGTYTLQMFSTLDGSIPTQYFGGTRDITTASTFTLTNAQHRTGLNQQLLVAASVSGIVRVPQGWPAGGVQVEVVRNAGTVDEPDWQAVSSARTNTAGLFKATGLDAGAFALRIDSNGDYPVQYLGGVTTPDAATRLSFTSGQAKAGVTYTLRPAATLDQVPSTTSLTLSTASRPYGTASLATATVAGAVAGPGTVLFTDGTKTLGTVTVSSGRAALTLPTTFAVGGHSIRATFTGTGALANSTSTSKALTVTRAKPTVGLTLASYTVKSTTYPKVTAVVTAKGTVPAGLVWIKDGSTVLKKVYLRQGKAAVTLPRLKVGRHYLTVYYVGSSTVLPASSTAKTLTVVS
jgi:5-hydroxyisourate hydrolase-like protein (transthyretin family)